MKLTILFKDNVFDCYMNITDSHGSRSILLESRSPVEDGKHYIDVEVYDPDFSLVLVPKISKSAAAYSSSDQNGVLGKLERGIWGALSSITDKAFLQVGCKYRVSDAAEGSLLIIESQSYFFDTGGIFEWFFEWLPTGYAFFEAYRGSMRLEPLDAFALNRGDVLKSTRMLSLLIPDTALFYPLQMLRVRHLTKNKKVFKTLQRFHFMTPDERRRILDN